MDKNKKSNWYNQLSLFEKFDHNPFADNSIKKSFGTNSVIIKQDTDRILLQASTGEVIGNSVFLERKTADKAKFVKLFRENIRSFYELKNSTFKVLIYIMDSTMMNKDLIYFNIDACKIATGIKSRATITCALANLLENKIIARSNDNHLFFINHHIFFNGNRATFAKTIEVEDSKNIGHNEKLLGIYNEQQTSEADTN